MKKNVFWKGFAVGSVLCIVVYATMYFKAINQPDILLDQIEVYKLDGEKDDLNNYTGKPLVVNVWATWCGPCVNEMPNFEAVKQEVGEQVNFVMISDEKPEQISKFVSEKPYTFTYLRSGKMMDEYGVSARPVSYFFNAKGQLVEKHVGGITVSKLNELIEKIQSNS